MRASVRRKLNPASAAGVLRYLPPRASGYNSDEVLGLTPKRHPKPDPIAVQFWSVDGHVTRSPYSAAIQPLWPTPRRRSRVLVMVVVSIYLPSPSSNHPFPLPLSLFVFFLKLLRCELNTTLRTAPHFRVTNKHKIRTITKTLRAVRTPLLSFYHDTKPFYLILTRKFHTTSSTPAFINPHKFHFISSNFSPHFPEKSSNCCST